MIKCNRFLNIETMNAIKIPVQLVLTAALIALSPARAATIAEVRQQIDPATGKPKDTATEFSVTGIVSARATLKDGQVLAFVQPAGEAGLPVLAGAAEAASLLPRNDVKFTGKLADGPLGFAVLQIKPGSVQVSGSNQPFGTPAACGADALKDMAGRYVKLTGVTFPGGKFDDSGVYKVKGDTADIVLRASKAVAGREMPAGPVNVYGVPIKVDGGWQLLAARFLPANGKEMQELATKHTCMTCHNADTKVVGPPYRDVAARYCNDPDAEQKLITQMENGGTGKWGPVPMLPFKGKIPPEEMKQLAQWVLGYRWDAVLAQ
jgi:cytochrome c551/c552